MKFVREQSKPISADSGLMDIARLIESGKLPPKSAIPGRVTKLDMNSRYDAHLLSYVEPRKLKPLKGPWSTPATAVPAW